MWNVAQLAVSLRLLSEAPPLIARLETFEARFREAYTAPLCRRLGVRPAGDNADWQLKQAIDDALIATRLPIDRFFFDAFGGDLPPSYGREWDAVRAALARHEPINGARAAYFSDAEPCAMLIDEVEAIWSAHRRAESASRSAQKTVAPRRAKQTAIARPIPVVPPVMMALRPFSDGCSVCASWSATKLSLHLTIPTERTACVRVASTRRAMGSPRWNRAIMAARELTTV